MSLPPTNLDASYPVPPLPLLQTKCAAVTKLAIQADCGFLRAASKCPLDVHGRGSAPRKGAVQVRGIFPDFHFQPEATLFQISTID